jgi:hypothetical protein
MLNEYQVSFFISIVAKCAKDNGKVHLVLPVADYWLVCLCYHWRAIDVMIFVHLNR